MLFSNVLKKIYKEAKQVHNIGGHVPIILVEDEIKVKSKSIISWESKGDKFCDAKENHRCVINFKHVIGIGKVGYNNVFEAFTNNKIASFAIVVIVNLLHEKLLRLVFVLCCTCNCFNAN